MEKYLFDGKKVADILVEKSAYSGVKKIVEKLAKDLELVTGIRPELRIGEIAESENKLGLDVVIGTVGRSAILERLEQEHQVDLSQIRGKREVYGWFFVDNRLVIVGSDKRGTIYGMFHLSEKCGVSHFVNWCGIKPQKREKLMLDESCEMISKEPSVRYRGFFINDEWPAFGTWCEHHFGGMNALAYEPIFELLLRLKGNYLWPAMWSGRFEDDGPGLLNAQLADEYGVVMGMSHHEPCLRQGEEYKYLRGKDSIYGDAWNFRTNRDGIIRFWEDGLKRSGQFENVITVGMRGEADTAILEEHATLADNIELLRDVLRTQRTLIQKNVNADLEKVPRMIALYKEVEEFFYGNDQATGLMNAPELEDVILMLCDDNYGNLRTLPTEEMRDHKGGYGMYYHFDYHGWPVSYEWINSSYLPKVWEQMCQAYDFGVRDLWIVNVGDLATQEFPLSFFLDLAYDFDKWGSDNPNSTGTYTAQWVEQQFGGFDQKMQADIATVLEGYTRIVHKRRPEANHAGVYHPVNERESEKLVLEIDALMERCRKLEQQGCQIDETRLSPLYALVLYPALGTLNVTKMQILAGMNAYWAKLGVVYANRYADGVRQCLKLDRQLVERYHEMDGGRWFGMGLSAHIGFVNWNEDECQNPLLMQVYPVHKPGILVTIDGTEQHAQGSPWLNQELELRDFLNPDCREAGVTLYAIGDQPSEYQIIAKPDWLTISSTAGTLAGALEGTPEREQLVLRVDREKISWEKSGCETGQLIIRTPDGECRIHIPVCVEIPEVPQGTFVDTQGYLAMEAEHFTQKSEAFQCLKPYGKTGSAVKAYPTTSYYSLEQAPFVQYDFYLTSGGCYEVELYLQPSNPVAMDDQICYALQVNHGEKTTYHAIEDGYRIGDHQEVWARGVLDQIRRKTGRVQCEQGWNQLRIFALTPGFVLEKIVIYPLGAKPLESYLGPRETYRRK